MRATAVAMLLTLLAAPAAAQEGNYRGECRKLTRQIARALEDVERARERDNELWERFTLRQIDSMAGRRARLCPEFAKKDDAFQRRLARLLKRAVQLGMTAMTFGAF